MAVCLCRLLYNCSIQVAHLLGSEEGYHEYITISLKSLCLWLLYLLDPGTKGVDRLECSLATRRKSVYLPKP